MHHRHSYYKAATTQCKTYTSVDDSNLDTLAGNTLVPQPVDLGHEMRREGIVLAIRLPLEDGGPRRANRVDCVLGNVIHVDGPQVLDGRHGGNLGSPLSCVLDILELDRRASEQLEVQVHALRGIVLDGVQQLDTVLSHAYTQSALCLLLH